MHEFWFRFGPNNLTRSHHGRFESVHIHGDLLLPDVSTAVPPPNQRIHPTRIIWGLRIIFRNHHDYLELEDGTIPDLCFTDCMEPDHVDELANCLEGRPRSVNYRCAKMSLSGKGMFPGKPEGRV